MLIVTTLLVWPESAMRTPWLVWPAASFEKTGGSRGLKEVDQSK